METVGSESQERLQPLKQLLDNSKGFWRRYRKNRVAVIGLGIVILFFFLAVLAAQIAPYDPFVMDPGSRLQSPSVSHLMGTDLFGRDIFSRIVYGTRISLFIGFVSATISAVIGIAVGAISGYYGGKLDEVLMRAVEIFIVIPTFFLILIIVAIFGGSIWNVMAIIGLTIWPSTTRLVRAEFLSTKEKEFVTAAISVGSKDAHIILREILPNAVFPAIVNMSLQVASAILTESSLSFLGLGDPNNVSWGWLLKDALRSMRSAWWDSVFPGIFISLAVISFNVIGDGLNDALNPYLKER